MASKIFVELSCIVRTDLKLEVHSGIFYLWFLNWHAFCVSESINKLFICSANGKFYQQSLFSLSCNFTTMSLKNHVFTDWNEVTFLIFWILAIFWQKGTSFICFIVWYLLAKNVIFLQGLLNWQNRCYNEFFELNQLIIGFCKV